MMYRSSNVIGDNSNSRGDSHPQLSEAASAYHRRPVPSYYAESASPTFTEPMGIIQSSQYTYATNPIPSPLYSPVESSQPPLSYKHNSLMAAVLLPTGIILLMNHPSSVPTISILFLGLIIYGLDLIRSRDGVVCITWLAVPVLSLLMGWSWLMRGDDDNSDMTYENGWTFLKSVFQTGAVAFFWALLAAWGTLQFEDWLTTYPIMSRQMEVCVHATAPLVLASFLCHSSAQYVNANYGPDAAATSAPHIFAVFLWVGLMTVGSCQASFSTNDETNKSTGKSRKENFIVTNNVALFQVLVLLLVPPSMHLITFWRRLLSRMADFDDWFDWFLSLAIPYLLTVFMKVLSKQKVADTPYASLPLIRQSGVLPLGVVFLTSLAIQQRYLIPLVHDFSYHYTGVKQSSWMFCFYCTGATVALLLTTWLWGRTSQGQPFLGEYHEDVLQLLLSLLGLLLGKGVGMPWNFAPLPILAFLGLSLWFSTRLLRYLGIVMFVFLASAFVIFTYRFAGIDLTLTLPFPLKSVSLIVFGMMVVASSALIGLVAGLAIRAPGGVLSSYLKRFDMAGILLVVYALVLMEMEIALIKRESTWAKIIGVHMVQDATVSDAMYTPELAYLTGVTLVGVSRMMKYFGMIKSPSSWIVIAFSIGKSFAIFIDKVHHEQEMLPLSPTDTLFDAILSGIAFLIMAVPHVFLNPIHVKASTRYQRNISGGPVLTTKSRRIILFYACILLPLAIFLAEFAVMEPFLAILLDNNNNMSIAGCAVLLLGACTCMWGVSLLSMLNHYLPDGGGERWKKVSGFVFLLGVMICFTFPMFNSEREAARSSSRNPYKLAAASAVGRDLMNRTRSRTGGWGVLSSLIATLLAVAGPLELKERRNRSGTKDQSLLFRTTIFSLLFGGGVAWFVTVQLMNESDLLPLVFTTISSMMIAFLCTVTSVLGYYIELENFGDVEQLANTVLISFVVFFLTAGIPSLLKLSAGRLLLGSEGWWSTYLVICIMSSLLISVSLGQRRTKDIRTRGLGNCFNFLAWLSALSLVFGMLVVNRFDEDYDSISIFGIPLPSFGILAAAPILLLLEGESPSTGAGRRLLGTNKQSSFHLSIPLHQRNRSLFVLFCGTAFGFLAAVGHETVLRGWGAGLSSRLNPDYFLENLRQST